MATTRLSVNINEATQDALRKEAGASGCTVTEAVRRAVAVLDFIREVEAEGSTLQIRKANGDEQDVRILV